ncbi:MAG: hypothetical protein B7733_10435 [Myxococcales bacterium FL481]|nr:MAG: hypothetical protein B7733_10435 [Myxococcales bacterium FL481]
MRNRVDLTSDKSDGSRDVGDSIEFARVEANVRRALFGTATEAPAVDRFRILERLGAGGMGVVYAAYDPKLDRQVALKLVRCRPDLEQTDVLAEAKALAQISHPNVVPVHDVGVWRDSVYIVMEFVRGETLRRYAARTGQTTQRVLAAYVQAGLGLQATHEAGIVHRDFKPDNAIMGHDGRVRLLDFGLARARPGGSSAHEGSLGLESQRAGTPAYMAPELLRGQRPSYASDQFAFCAALREALSSMAVGNADRSVEPSRTVATDSNLGETASHDRSTRHDPVGAVRDDDVAGGSRSLDSYRYWGSTGSDGADDLPPMRRQPLASRFVADALDRGCASDPDDRFPAMADLLKAIQRDRLVHRRLFAAGGGVALVAVGMLVGSIVATEADPTVQCSIAPSPIEERWSTESRRQLFASWGTSDNRYANAEAARLQQELHDFSRRWEQHHHDACVERHLGTSSDELLDRRATCLDRGAHAWGTLAELASTLQPEQIDGFALAVQALPEPERCSESGALLAWEAPPVDSAESVRSLSVERERVRLLTVAGELEEAGASGRRLVSDARALGYGPLLADARLLEGRISLLREESDAAEILTEALDTALLSGAYRPAVEAWARRAFVVATRSRSSREAINAMAGAEFIDALASGLDNAHFERGLLYNNLGCAALAAGERRAAHGWFLKAVPMIDEAPSSRAAELLHARTNLALVTEDPDLREERFTEGVAGFESWLGPEHPLSINAAFAWSASTRDPLAARERLASVCDRYDAYHPNLDARRSDCRYQLAWRSLFTGDRVAAAEHMSQVQCDGCDRQPRIAEGYMSLLTGDAETAHHKFDRLLAASPRRDDTAWWVRRERAEIAVGVALAAAQMGDLRLAATTLGDLEAELAQLAQRHPTPYFQQLRAFVRSQRERVFGAPVDL